MAWFSIFNGIQNILAYWGELIDRAMQKATKVADAPKVAPAKGMSGGMIAGIGAGIAVAGGAIYLMTRKKDKPTASDGPWTDRVATEQPVSAREV